MRFSAIMRHAGARDDSCARNPDDTARWTPFDALDQKQPPSPASTALVERCEGRSRGFRCPQTPHPLGYRTTTLFEIRTKISAAGNGRSIADDPSGASLHLSRVRIAHRIRARGEKARQGKGLGMGPIVHTMERFVHSAALRKFPPAPENSRKFRKLIEFLPPCLPASTILLPWPPRSDLGDRSEAPGRHPTVQAHLVIGPERPAATEAVQADLPATTLPRPSAPAGHPLPPRCAGTDSQDLMDRAKVSLIKVNVPLTPPPRRGPARRDRCRASVPPGARR